MKVQTTNYEIVGNGCVHVPYRESIQFDIEGMSFKLMFEKSTENTRAHIKTALENDSNDSQIMVLHAYNFEGSILNTVEKNMDLAKIEGKSLSLRLSISSINKREIEENEVKIAVEDKLVYYTWYLQKTFG